VTCQNPGAYCTRDATRLYKVRPTGTQVALCDPCHAVLEAMGLDIVPVETGWLARAVRNELPARVEREP